MPGSSDDKTLQFKLSELYLGHTWWELRSLQLTSTQDFVVVLKVSYRTLGYKSLLSNPYIPFMNIYAVHKFESIISILIAPAVTDNVNTNTAVTTMDHAYCGIRSGFISVGFVLIVA
jgi:hypothetical protein